MKTIIASLAGALCLVACAMHERAPESRSVRAEGAEPVLLTSSGAMEIQVRDGRIFQVVPATRPGESERVTEIKNLAELKMLYREAAGRPLPSESPAGTLQINGWSGLECVRLARACGPSPADASKVLVVLRIE